MKKSPYDEHYLCNSNSVPFFFLAAKWSINEEHISEVKKA